MKQFRTLMAVAGLAGAQAALADDAYLRLRCDGDAAGASVFVNDVKKGECPIDLTVPDGNIRLLVRKDLDQGRYRTFEKALFLPAGAMKRETVELGEVRFTAEGQRIENVRLARAQAEAAVKAEQDAKAAAVAAEQRRQFEEDARYGSTNAYLHEISTRNPADPIFGPSTHIVFSPISLPFSTLGDLSDGKKLYRFAADPVVFANPEAMVARVQRPVPADPARAR